MSVKFRVVEKKNLGKDQEQNPTKMYAQVIYGDLIPYDSFLEEVADGSGVGSAQVKGVLDRFNVVLRRHLALGQRISVGELGIFRFGVGSKGALTEKDFSTDLIKKPKVIFVPGAALQISRRLTTYEKGTVVTVEKEVECDKPHAV